MADDRADRFVAKGANAFRIEHTAVADASPLFTNAERREGGIHRPVRPSDDLGAIVGAGPMPRSEIVSRAWAYIKQNRLQDETDGRQINADAKLEKVFGKKRASMFEMNKLLSAHIEPTVGPARSPRQARRAAPALVKKA